MHILLSGSYRAGEGVGRAGHRASITRGVGRS